VHEWEMHERDRDFEKEPNRILEIISSMSNITALRSKSQQWTGKVEETILETNLLKY
jgi:hypothetical protein